LRQAEDHSRMPRRKHGRLEPVCEGCCHVQPLIPQQQTFRQPTQMAAYGRACVKTCTDEKVIESFSCAGLCGTPRSNRGAPGVDGQDFADVEEYGVEKWLGELALALKEGTYRPHPIRRVFIPKTNGKLRPLGISTLRDRTCMTAAMLVLEPIFEADLPPEQYGYRPGRNAQQAVTEVQALMFRGHPDTVDADLADNFGSIRHADLLKSVARRIVDRRVLHLLLVDRELQLTHDLAQLAQGLFGLTPLAQDHEVIGVGHEPRWKGWASQRSSHFPWGVMAARRSFISISLTSLGFMSGCAACAFSNRAFASRYF